jgi:hypothetical protein
MEQAEDATQAFLKAFESDERYGRDPSSEYARGLACVSVSLEQVSSMLNHLKKMAEILSETTKDLIRTIVIKEQHKVSVRENHEEEAVGTLIEEEVEENERSR